MRSGKDARLPPHSDTGRTLHRRFNVAREMLLQIAEFYSGLPDVRTMPLSEIRFWYEGMRPTLRANTKPR